MGISSLLLLNFEWITDCGCHRWLWVMIYIQIWLPYSCTRTSIDVSLHPLKICVWFRDKRCRDISALHHSCGDYYEISVSCFLLLQYSTCEFCCNPTCDYIVEGCNTESEACDWNDSVGTNLSTFLDIMLMTSTTFEKHILHTLTLWYYSKSESS